MFRRGFLAAAILGISVTAAGAGVVTQAAAAAPRADPTLGSCTAGTIFNVAGSQQTGASVGADAANLYSLDVTTGANTLIGRFSSGNTPVNGLGVTHNLSAAYAVAQNSATGGQQIYTFANDGATSATTNAPNTGLTLVMGAVDPANGIYYYGGYTGSGATLTVAIYGYNPATGTPLGRLVNVSLAGTGFSTGDFAFDGKGNLFIVAGTNSTSAANTSQIRRVNGPLPTTGPTVTLPSTTLATKTAPAGSGFYNGIAFAANGTLYAQYATTGSGTGTGATPSTATLEALDPGNAATLATTTQTGVPVGNSILTDLAGCSLPGTLTLRKNLPHGRARPQDQFRMQITGGDITEGGVATTAGAAPGIQPQEVGPLPAVPPPARWTATTWCAPTPTP